MHGIYPRPRYFFRGFQRVYSVRRILTRQSKLGSLGAQKCPKGDLHTSLQSWPVREVAPFEYGPCVLSPASPGQFPIGHFLGFGGCCWGSFQVWVIRGKSHRDWSFAFWVRFLDFGGFFAADTGHVGRRVPYCMQIAGRLELSTRPNKQLTTESALGVLPDGEDGPLRADRAS